MRFYCISLVRLCDRFVCGGVLSPYVGVSEPKNPIRVSGHVT